MVFRISRSIHLRLSGSGRAGFYMIWDLAGIECVFSGIQNKRAVVISEYYIGCNAGSALSVVRAS